MAVDIEEAIAGLLLAKAAVIAIVESRVYPNRVPQQVEFPAVIFRRLGGGSQPVLGATVCPVRSAMFQVESWSAVSQEEARTLDRAVQTIAPRVSFVWPVAPDPPAWWIQALRLNRDTDQDNPQVPIDASDKGLFCSFCEMFVGYQPA